MKYIFAFLLTNGTTELRAFTATEFADAQRNANAYGQLAYAKGELYEIVWRP